MGWTLKIEFKRHWGKKSFYAFLAFLLIGCIIQQFGISRYKWIIDNQKEFIQSEQKSIDSLINYMQYGTIGFKTVTKPSPLIAIFHNNTAFSELMGIIDSSIRLRIEENKQGAGAFVKPTGAFLDLSWFLLIFGSISVMIWSFHSFRNNEYIRTLENHSSKSKVFFSIMFARALLIAAGLGFILITVVLQFLVNGLYLNSREILALVLSFGCFFLLFILFSWITSALGASKNLRRDLISIIFIWLILVILWPEALNMFISSRAENTLKSVNKSELGKLDLMHNFEVDALKNTQRYEKLIDKKESDRRMAEYHWKNIFPKIEAIDKDMVSATARMSKTFHLLSIFNPVTLLKSINNEVSGSGYKAYLEMYEGNVVKRRGFLRYIYDKRFYGNYKEVYPYISPDKAIIPASPQLPYYFLVGLLLLMIYLSVAFYFSYRRFKSYLFPAVETSYSKCAFNFQTGKYYRINTSRCDRFKFGILNFFSGMKGFDGKILLNGIELNPQEERIAYITDPGKIPGLICVDNLYELVGEPVPEKIKGKRFDELSGFEKYRVLFDLAAVRKCSIYLMDEFMEDVDTEVIDEISKLIETLKTNSLIIDIGKRNQYNIAPDQSLLIVKDRSDFILKVVC